MIGVTPTSKGTTMARYLGPDDLPLDPVEARGLLAGIGTEIHPRTTEPAAVAEVLADGEREVRAEVDLEPPADDVAADQGMGAWHVNAQHEAHTVLSGTGLMQFMTAHGPVTAVVEAGDVVLVRGGEHRYRPLTAQRWAIRHSGGADADLGARETGRAPSPWPALP
jgi:mannose-6-phosphate isomerase-like protein (cupin superfamily)